VDDFFGRAWVEAFCGGDAARTLGDRLDASEVAEFRRQLGFFYARVFEKHDRASLCRTTSPPFVALLERYVVPDVLEHRAGFRSPAYRREEHGTRHRKVCG